MDARVQKGARCGLLGFKGQPDVQTKARANGLRQLEDVHDSSLMWVSIELEKFWWSSTGIVSARRKGVVT